MHMLTDAQFATFGESGSKWSVEGQQGVVMTAAKAGDVLRLRLAQTAGVNWHGELRFAPFAVEEGEVCHLSFEARAEVPFTFSVWLGQRDAPHASLVAQANHFGERAMTTEWRRFTHTWTASRSERNARLVYALGQVDNVVELRACLLAKA